MANASSTLAVLGCSSRWDPKGCWRLASTRSTKIPLVDASMTLLLIQTGTSRNAKAGDFCQVRILKVF